MKWSKRLSKWFKDQKIGRKIFYAFIISFLIPVIAVQGIMLYVISNNMRDRVNDLMFSQLTQMSERVNLTLEVYTNLVYQIYADNEIIKDINKYQSAEGNKEKVYRKISNQIQQYGISVSGIRCISIILPDGNDITYDFGQASAVDSLWDEYEDIRDSVPYMRAQGAANMVVSPTMRIVRDSKEERVFHVSKCMYDFDNIEQGAIATIVMSIDEEVLNKICVMNQSLQEEEAYAINFIVDKGGNVMTYPNSFYSGITLGKSVTAEEFVKKTGELKGKKTAINMYEDKEMNWIFYNVYDEDYMFRDIRNTQCITLLLGIMIIAVSMALIRYTLKLIQQSTQAVVSGILEVQQGNLDIEVPVYGEDEIGQIADNFNTMTKKVKSLIEEVADATELKKEAEIRALEAQINPHFLYNTLDSINWMAIEKQEYKISNMLRNLGIILRYSINNSNKMVTVQELADWLDKYIELQKMRFNDAFSYEVQVEKEIGRERIQKLLLQPFVENAIVHGFKEVSNGGILRIDISYSENKRDIDIIIEDNGKGMSQEKANKFNHRNTVENDEKSIGMKNAFARINMYYGEKASWNVRSMKGMGTVITLKIPLEKEGHVDENYNC